jgi:ribosomal-protein-alanine N-acetyltransferase
MAAPADLTFRTWRTRDVDALVEQANNRNVWINLKDRFPHPYTRDDAECWIGMNHLILGPPVNFAIDLGGEPVGGVGVEPLEDVYHRSANIGYWVAEPHWGKGIATAAVEFICDYALRTFPLERLQADVFGWNAASARVLEKLGFTLEGRRRRAVIKDGRVGDLLLYARMSPAAGSGELGPGPSSGDG